jgi:hypothetical protein
VAPRDRGEVILWRWTWEAATFGATAEPAPLLDDVLAAMAETEVERLRRYLEVS